MPFPNWRTTLIAHPTEAAGNRNTAEFLAAFCAGSSAATRTAVLAEDDHTLILARSPGESKLCLYHNFVIFDGCQTCPGVKLAVLEGLGPLTPPFLLPALALNSASCQVPDPETLTATTTAEKFCETTAGQQNNFCNANFVVCPPWMAKDILGQSSCNPVAVAQVVKNAHRVF